MLLEESDEEVQNKEEAVAEGMRKSKIATFSRFDGIIVLIIVVFAFLGSMSSDIDAKSQGVAVEDRNDIPEKYKRGDDKVTISEGSIGSSETAIRVVNNGVQVNSTNTIVATDPKGNENCKLTLENTSYSDPMVISSSSPPRHKHLQGSWDEE